MGYRIMGRAHAAALVARGRLAGAAGQGTVEYVALILLVAGLFATVVLAAGGREGQGHRRRGDREDPVDDRGGGGEEGLSAGRRPVARGAGPPTMAPWPHAPRTRARARSPSSTPASAG